MEIKILCPCGAKFKFDVEPVNGHSPGTVHCPSCGKDSTAATNDLIRQQLGSGVPATPVAVPPTAPPRISVSIPAAPIAATPTAPPAPDSSSKAGIPAIRIPSGPTAPPPAPAPAPTAAPIHVGPAQAAPAHASAAPAAPAAPAPPKPVANVGPKMTVMPVPETIKSLSVKPPGEATVHEAPPSAAPSNAAGDPKAPGSPKMAFMPVPAAGTGASLSVSGAKAEEKTSGVAAPPAPTPSHAHPAAAKMVRTEASPKSGGTFGMGVTGAMIGCLIGAGLWYFLALNVLGGWRILAWIPGIVGGFGAILLGRKQSEKLGMAAAIVAGIITISAQFAIIAAINDQSLTEESEANYKAQMALAKKAGDAKTDAQVRDLMNEDLEYSGFRGTTLKEMIQEVAEKVEKAKKAEESKTSGAPVGDEDEITEYRKKRVPELIKFSKGDPGRSKYMEKERARLEENGEILYEKKWISMGIWIFSSIEFAFLLGRGKKKE